MWNVLLILCILVMSGLPLSFIIRLNRKPERLLRDWTRTYANQLSYNDLIKQLYQVNMYNPVKLGLENMHRINEALGFPVDGIPIIHVGGTNGKGSVAHKVTQSLIASGIRTGLYTSPHISSFRERIKVNEELLTHEDVEVRI
jgi:folylpolyglutamate synthase/dihydropteroate synthase